MSCIIIYDENNNPTGVQDDNGQRSKLFDQIISNPQVKDFNEAVDIYLETKSSEVKFAIIGKNGAETLDKAEEVSFRIDNLNIALEMEQENKTASEIKYATGWEKVNDQWKYEEEDFTLKDKEIELGKEYKFEDIVEDNKLYQAYPELRTKTIKFNKDGINRYNTNTQSFEIDARRVSNSLLPGGGKSANIEEFFSRDTYRLQPTNNRVLLHEATHYIQQQEGFYRGGSPDAIRARAEAISGVEAGDNEQVYRDKILKTISEKESLSKQDKKVIEAFEQTILGNSEALTMAYFKLAGEVEARAVEERSILSTEEKLKTLIAETEKNALKISQEDKIFLEDLSQLPYQEPQLKYQTQDGRVFDNYNEALQNTVSEEISAGVNTVEGFKELFKISPNMNVTTTEGFINHMVKSDLITSKNNEGNFVVQGKTEAKQKINAEAVKELFRKQFGIGSARVNADNTITITEENKRTNITITKANGEQVSTPISELNKPFSELKKLYDVETTSAILANQAFKKMVSGNKTLAQEFVSENELQDKLKNLLKKFGIKTLSFDQYLKDYSKRTNLPITAKALADLGNKLIAFKDGIVEQDDLVEEVAHLIEASIPMEKKENVLRNIHKTQEWAQYYEQYKDVYSTEEELRKEILGKAIANSIKEQFQARNNSTTEDSIISKIKEFFDDFISRVKAYFKEDYKKQLDDLNKEVYKNLMNETLNLDIKGTEVLFSNASEASSNSKRLYDSATKILDRLREQTKALSNSSDKASLNRAEEQLENAENMKAITTLVRLASSQVELIRKSAENINNKYPLSQEERVTYQNIKQRLAPALSEVRTMIDDEQIISEIDDILKKVAVLDGTIKKDTKIAIIEEAKRIAESSEMTPKEKQTYVEFITNAMEATQKDTDFFHAHLGSLLTARAPLLNMAGNVIERMNLQHNENLQKTVKPFLDKIKKLSTKEFEGLFDFKNGGWLLHEIDKEKEAKWDENKKKDILRALGITVPEGTNVDEFVDTLEEDQQKVFKKSWYKISKSKVNTYFTEAYRQALENHEIKVAGTTIKNSEIDENAKAIDDVYKAQSTGIRIQYGGNLTKVAQAELAELAKKRDAEANPRGADGKLIKGLKEVYDEEKGRYFIMFDNDILLNPKTTAREVETAKVIEGLNHLNYIKQDFFSEKREGMPDSFLKALEASDNKMEFLEMNSYISFPDSFYEQFKNNSGLVIRLRESGETDLAEDIRQQQAIINRILRVNRVFNRPSETNFIEMNIVQKNEVKLAQTELEKLYTKAKSILTDEAVENELDLDNVVNDSYYKYLEDSGEDELSFILENTTANGVASIKSAQRIVEGGRISKYFQKWFSDNMTEDEKKEALIKYARTKLLPYLKRSEPIGYSQAMKDVANGTLSVEDLIKRTDIIKVTPNLSFYEYENENVNQDWLRNRDLKREQWSKEYLKEVGNDKYYETFGINRETGDREGNKNEDLWQARQAILDYTDTMIDFQGLTGKRSRYLMPQVRATEIERLLKLNPQMVGQAIKDWTTFRPEEQEKGSLASDGLYTIPTYYNTPLEDSKELTKNLTYAYVMWGNQASLYKSRKENIGDMFIIEDALNNTNFTTKKAENTQTYRMFKNFMEYNFYGVRETFSAEFELGGRKIDAGKILMSLNRWAKKTNVTNIVTPVTSLLQSSTQKFMERVIGETTNNIASNEGNKLFLKLAPGASREVMGFESKSELNVIGEALGLYSIVHRFEDSQYSKVGRTALNVGSKLHELGNFPVIGRAITSIISDYRIVDGRILSYNQFKKKDGVNEADWTKYEMFSPYFLKAVKDGVLDFSNVQGLEGKIVPPNGQSVQEYLEGKKLDMSKRMLSFIQRIDSQIPQHQKASAQRDARTNFFLSHLSWLLTAIPNKFKNAHYNLSEEGFIQEGSWRTTAKFLNKIIFNPKQTMKVWKDLSENEKKNLKRTVVELGFANALAFTAILLARYNDDDKDPNYALAVADMFMTRLANEQISSTVAIPSGIYGVFDNPLLIKSKLEDWVKVNKLVGTPEERSNYFGKVLPFYKDIERFSDPLATRQKYSHFQTNDDKLFYRYSWLTNFLKKD